MAYRFFLDGFELPVAPAKLETKINNQNKTFVLANMLEVNRLKKAGLTEITFTAPVPHGDYPWKNSSASPNEVLGKLEELKTSEKPFQFIVNRERDDRLPSFNTNMKVSLEEYNIVEDAEDNSDLSIEITLKQYVDYGAKVIYVTNKNEGTVNKKPSSSNPNKPSNSKKKTYTVKHGDSMWEIAKKYLGDGSKYKQLYNMNKDLIDKRNKKEGTSKYTIYTGQVLRLE